MWFRNSHEQRNDLLRYGFMLLHKKGDINYCEKDLASAPGDLVPERVRCHVHRHTSYVVLKKGGRIRKILVDSEDSFYMLCDLMRDVDLYFCAGYNSNFFIEKRFPGAYEWQSEEDISWYRNRTKELIDAYGSYFKKVKKFIPIGPNFATTIKTGFVKRKYLNLRDKLSNFFLKKRSWENLFETFNSRYHYLLKLRQLPLKYDIVLKDSLWGWPNHRYLLHKKLQLLSSKYEIYSQLNWNDDLEAIKRSSSSIFSRDEFPVLSQKLFRDDYERMMAQSRLAVFATGYHWGWRNIMTFAFMIGLPVHMDKLILEPYFDMSEFLFSLNLDQWGSLEEELLKISGEKWEGIKLHNQRIYDRYMSPANVSQYVIEQCFG